MDTVEIPAHHTLRISLLGNKDNVSYSGTLFIRNLSSLLPSSNGDGVGMSGDDDTSPRVEDPSGASYYVVAVVMVYGFSIVMLIASRIKRKHHKLAEDKQINKYLQEFLVVQEKSSRDSYRHLKSSIIQKLNREKSTTCKHLSKATFPIMAIALPNRNTQEALERRKSLAHVTMYQSIEEEVVRPQNSESSTPDVLDRSLEPFVGVDPALMDTSFHEVSEQEVGVDVDDDTDPNMHNDSGSTTTTSSTTYLPAVTVPPPGEVRKTTELLEAPPTSGLERRVSWSDKQSESLTENIDVDRRASCKGPSPPPNLLGGDSHISYSRPSSPKVLKYARKKDDTNEFGKWMQRCEKRRRSIDPQFDLAAALLRKSLAYTKQKGAKQKQQKNQPKQSKQEEAVDAPETSATPESDKNQGISTLDVVSVSDSEDASVWLVNEVQRPQNGVLRENDRELFTCTLNRGMGHRSPLLKDQVSPVTPESPHFGARLTPQPLLTPPPAKSRINPFFKALGHRSSHDNDVGRNSPRGSCLSPQGSPNLRGSPLTDEGDDEESLLHITCV